MIRVLFFASYRERLGTGELQLPLDFSPSTLSGLRELLSVRGDEWRDVLADRNTLVSVNAVVTHEDSDLQEGDEVAFFPPVTGG